MIHLGWGGMLGSVLDSESEYFNERSFGQDTMNIPDSSTSSRHNRRHGTLLLLTPRKVVTVHSSAYYMITHSIESTTQ